MRRSVEMLSMPANQHTMAKNLAGSPASIDDVHEERLVLVTRGSLTVSSDIFQMTIAAKGPFNALHVSPGVNFRHRARPGGATYVVVVGKPFVLAALSTHEITKFNGGPKAAHATPPPG